MGVCVLEIYAINSFATLINVCLYIYLAFLMGIGWKKKTLLQRELTSFGWCHIALNLFDYFVLRTLHTVHNGDRFLRDIYRYSTTPLGKPGVE